MKNDRDIIWYVERAKEHQGYSSDTKLDIALGYKGSFISYLRKGKALPSPDKMVDICKLAGVDPAIGLMDLAIWNAHGEAKKTYRNILKKITAAIAFIVLFFASTPSAYAYEISSHGLNINNEQSIYYHIICF